MSLRLTDPQEDRYQRLKLIRWWDQGRIRGANALVLGAGALGNEVAKNLALLGFGHVWVVDFDRIETTNLTRSVLFRAGDVGGHKAEVLAARASEINPDSQFHALAADVRHDLGLHFLSRMDLVFGCLDNREARYYINRGCFLLRKPFVDGGLDTLNGSVSLFQPPETACYECTLSATDRAELQKRISCLANPEPELKHHVPTAPTIASIVGGLQVQIGLRLLHGLDVPSGKRLGLYGLSDVFFDFKLQISEDCGSHAALDPLPADIEALDASANDPLHLVFAAAQRAWNASELTWDFDRDLITGLICMNCGAERDFAGTHARDAELLACPCGGAFKTIIASGFTGAEPWGRLSLRELRFPSQHIYCAITPSGRRYFHLN